MKIDETIRGILATNLRQYIRETNQALDTYRKALLTSRDVEEILKAKQEYLVFLLENIPVHQSHCYFCQHRIHYGAGCDGCKWRPIHGQCNNSESTFNKVSNKRDELSTLIDEEYYQGETYEEPAS